MIAKNEKIREQIKAALTGQPSGLTSLDIRERGEILDAPRCSSVLIQMKKSGEILEHEGESPRKSRYSLNPEFIVDGATAGAAAGGGRKKAKKRKPKKGPGKARKVRKASPIAERSAIDREFVPAITVDHSLVLITKGTHPPQFFTPEETASIASLLGANFEMG